MHQTTQTPPFVIVSWIGTGVMTLGLYLRNFGLDLGGLLAQGSVSATQANGSAIMVICGFLGAIAPLYFKDLSDRRAERRADLSGKLDETNRQLAMTAQNLSKTVQERDDIRAKHDLLARRVIDMEEALVKLEARQTVTEAAASPSGSSLPTLPPAGSQDTRRG